ncbi:MAG: DUF4838 domain-containing protein [Armatimonadetes bacterium]|nr:DUF4838 domain-containing protein [Armatimonadota bacterium]
MGLSGQKAPDSIRPTTLARQQGLPEGPEAWRLKTVGDRLVIAGGRPRGTLYGVYQFLEGEVGVRWWTPWEESVPSRPTLTFDQVDRQGAPKLRYRDIYDEIAAPKLFACRNRVNGHFTGLTASHGGTVAYGPPYHVHTFYLYLPPEKHFAEHPEWYSEIGGQRKNGNYQLCLTNPGLRQEMINRVKAAIETSRDEAVRQGVPPPAVFSVSQNDWYGACECASCQAIAKAEGSEAGPLLDFVNAIADAVREPYPWVYIDTLSYQYTLTPPKSIRPRDNVIIRLCDLTNPDQSRPVTHPNNTTFKEAVEGWSKIARNLRIWDYAVTFGTFSGLPYPSLKTMAPDYRFFLEHNTEGLFIEHEYPVIADFRDLKTWVQMKLLEDPYQSTEALTRDFTDGYYGAAGAGIRDYLAALEAAAERKPSHITAFGTPSIYRYLDLAFVREAHRIFDQAEAAVAADPVLRKRVQHARLPLDRATLYVWRNLCREHITGGGTPENLGLDRQAVAARAKETMRVQIDQRLPAGRRDHEKQEAARIIDGLVSVPGFVELPEEFRKLPAADVVDLTPDTFRLWANEAKLVADKEADLGSTARLRMADTKPDPRGDYLLTPEKPMPWGVYDTINKKGLKSAPIKYEDVTDGGYHRYKLENVTLTEGCYVYYFWSWVIQADLGGIEPGAAYDIYTWVKFDGPGFPHGDANEENAISVARIIAVRRR